MLSLLITQYSLQILRIFLLFISKTLYAGIFHKTIILTHKGIPIFLGVLWPFQEYFTYIEPIVHQRWRKPENPGENHLTIRKQRYSHNKCFRGEVKKIQMYQSFLVEKKSIIRSNKFLPWVMLSAYWVKISADNILKLFSDFFFQKIGFDISCKLSPKETICMNCQSLFSEKKKKK